MARRLWKMVAAAHPCLLQDALGGTQAYRRGRQLPAAVAENSDQVLFFVELPRPAGNSFQQHSETVALL
jgi:hypothetical protein